MQTTKAWLTRAAWICGVAAILSIAILIMVVDFADCMAAMTTCTKDPCLREWLRCAGSNWCSNILFFFLGLLVSYHFYIKGRKDAAPLNRMVLEVWRKVITGVMTRDQAAGEVIKALETGALRPADIPPFEWMLKFCPEPGCGGDVELVNAWSTEHGEGFGGTMRCKKCSWSKVFSG